uniref:G-patch domain-containing protein n=1 Tax=Heterorhabditis bacteriophora TaxID=37862 RepID=A0A1I7XK96_HETBA
MKYLDHYSKNSSLDDTLRREQVTKKLEEEKLSIQDKSSPSDPTDKILQQNFGPDNDAFPDNDDDQCEEWERHEALHDDVTEQDRTKPRKYEEEMEIIWEKGGPGLVWYTDKNYWDEREKGTDCDWAWADDWDVDYSVYYEGKSAGTKDGRDAVEIKEDENRRYSIITNFLVVLLVLGIIVYIWILFSNGKLEQSVFMKKVECKTLERKRRRSGSDVIDIEKFSKRIGSKLLGKMGWQPGAGLGKLNQGRLLPVALHLEEDGQAGTEKKGFGYRGEKMQRFVFEKRPIKHSIASSFDTSLDRNTIENKQTDDKSSMDVLFRRSDTTKMKYRNI